MAGRIIREGHACDTPSNRKHEPGTIWQCDECHRYQRLTRMPSGAVLWVRMGVLEVAFAGLGTKPTRDQEDQ